VRFDGTAIELRARIDFEPESDHLVRASQAVLDDVVELLVARPGLVRVEIRAHSAPRVERFGRGLTDRRADAVRRYLIEHGIVADRLSARGYGETQPMQSNETEAGRRANTRIEIAVLPPP
jgi:outer membrane protein OmpA-like peptidoglycan-associated protein